jgi:hypothetical protein
MMGELVSSDISFREMRHQDIDRAVEMSRACHGPIAKKIGRCSSSWAKALWRWMMTG